MKLLLFLAWGVSAQFGIRPATDEDLDRARASSAGASATTRAPEPDDSAPPGWPASKLFSLNPGCTQRILVLSLKVINGVSFRDQNFDARGWVTVYQQGVSEIAVDRLRAGHWDSFIAPELGVHNRKFQIPLTYVVDSAKQELWEGFPSPTVKSGTNCKRNRATLAWPLFIAMKLFLISKNGKN